MKLQDLTRVFAQLETTSSRRTMVQTLGTFLSQLAPEELAPTIYLSQASLGPPFTTLEFGINDKLASRALARAAEQPREAIDQKAKSAGDLGTVAAGVLGSSSQQLSITTAFGELQSLAQTAGTGSQTAKTDLLANLLAKMSGQEAKYTIRIILGRLRLGMGDATIMDAISYSYSRRTEARQVNLRPVIEHAYNLTSDLGRVAAILTQQGPAALKAMKPTVGLPIRPELAERLASPNEIIHRLGRVLAEPKYDGIRLQVHRDANQVDIFTRRLENVSAMFPEIITAARSQVGASAFIIEGEATVFNPDTGEYLPFQITSQRRRKHDIAASAHRYPLRLFAFDLLSVEGQDYTSRPLAQRRQKLEQLVGHDVGNTITLSTGIVTADVTELEHFFETVVQSGVEGIVAKRPDASYVAGARTFDWVKLKRGYQVQLRDTVDVVLVGYLLGKGQRAKLGIGSLLAAVYDTQHDRFRTIAKVGSGLSEERWQALRELLNDYRVDHVPARVDALLTPDVWVEPHYVMEVFADEVSRSPIHTAGKYDDQPGYALRFPRFTNWLREDKRPEDATTENEILELYKLQRQTQTK